MNESVYRLRILLLIGWFKMRIFQYLWPSIDSQIGHQTAKIRLDWRKDVTSMESWNMCSEATFNDLVEVQLENCYSEDKETLEKLQSVSVEAEQSFDFLPMKALNKIKNFEGSL